VTCREFADFLDDFMTDELAGDVRAAFERHLGRCDNCRKYLRIYEQSVRLGRRAFDDGAAAVPSEVPDELVDAILAARGDPPPA
jgi:anti-sigma factor RsiW